MKSVMRVIKHLRQLTVNINIVGGMQPE